MFAGKETHARTSEPPGRAQESRATGTTAAATSWCASPVLFSVQSFHADAFDVCGSSLISSIIVVVMIVCTCTCGTRTRWIPNLLTHPQQAGSRYTHTANTPP